jgi:hypothetical protein
MKKETKQDNVGFVYEMSGFLLLKDKGILDEEQLKKIEKELSEKYGIKDKSLYVKNMWICTLF